MQSGASKHYAYIEMSSQSVAEIVADTMNNYLLMGHLLKCQVG
jgi:nucleolar protein 15